MRKVVVKIKMSADWWQEIADLYEGIWANYEPKGAHELLLHGHVAELRAKLVKKLENDQKSFTIPFGGTESLAFLQTWHGHELPKHPLRQTIIRDMIEAFDHAQMAHKTLTIWIKK